MQRAPSDSLRLTPLRLRLGVDEVGKAFDLRKIDLAVDEGAPGKFARLSWPQARNENQRLERLPISPPGLR